MRRFWVFEFFAHSSVVMRIAMFLLLLKLVCALSGERCALAFQSIDVGGQCCQCRFMFLLLLLLLLQRGR